MKKLLSLLTAVAFASTALFAEAATPRAAEDPGAPVYSTPAPLPKVQKMKSAKGKKATKGKKASHKKHRKGAKGKNKNKSHNHRH